VDEITENLRRTLDRMQEVLTPEHAPELIDLVNHAQALVQELKGELHGD